MTRFAILAGALACVAAPVAAQTYPAKPVRIVVGFPAGGPTDIVSRTMAPKMSEALGQTVLVDNRGGAGGVIATEQVSKAAPDGYTLLMGTIGGIAVAMSLLPNRGYDTLRDFAPITQAVTVTNLLVVHPSVPAKTVKELLAIARTKPGRLNYASSGNCTVTHLAGELFKLMGKVDITHVPFKGGAPALTALISGEVDLSYENSLVVTPHVKAGKVKALAVTGSKRSGELPDVPSMAEAGFPGVNTALWSGFFAPVNVPAAITAKLEDALRKAIADPGVSDKLKGMAVSPGGGTTAAQFRAMIDQDIQGYEKIIKAANLKFDN